jgi:hypothetical protein
MGAKAQVTPDKPIQITVQWDKPETTRSDLQRCRRLLRSAGLRTVPGQNCQLLSQGEIF